MRACRQWRQGRQPDRNHAAHAGLLLDRYLTKPVKDNDHPDKLKELIDQTVEIPFRISDLYKMAFERWRDALFSIPSVVYFVACTEGRTVVGLSGESVLETGIALHHSYGVPVLPGSGLKGLCSHYCHTVWGAKVDGYKEGGAIYRQIFGDTDDAGHIAFYDAWLLPSSLRGCLVKDVMTPHHHKYNVNGEAAPTDFDDPKLVTFLNARGCFLVVVSCDISDDNGAAWAKLVIQMLEEALKHWGVGGKTRAGYGRLQRNMAKQTVFERRYIEVNAKDMSLEERIRAEICAWNNAELAEALGKHKNKTKKIYQGEWDAFIQCLRDAKGDLIESWDGSTKGQEKSAYKNYKKFIGELNGDRDQVDDA